MVATKGEAIELASDEYVGRWIRLVSTTNWDKGDIILAWRNDLIERGVPASEYSDEAWSRRVGGVSPQHVGRLRRVAERFVSVRESYPGLFWSHFQAGLDWGDAEMWLEGAVQNGWSVKQMLNRRWETLGSPADQRPSDEDVVAGETDEDVDATLDEGNALEQRISGDLSVVQDTAGDDDAEESDEDDHYDSGDDATESDDSRSESRDSEVAAKPAPHFARLPNLPDDLTDALEAFKLAIVRHKISGWEEISQDAVLECLDALRALALAPVEAPF